MGKIEDDEYISSNFLDSSMKRRYKKKRTAEEQKEVDNFWEFGRD